MTDFDYGPLASDVDPVADRAIAERRELLRIAYSRAIEMHDRGLYVEPSHLRQARAFVAANPPLAGALGTGEGLGPG